MLTFNWWLHFLRYRQARLFCRMKPRSIEAHSKKPTSVSTTCIKCDVYIMLYTFSKIFITIPLIYIKRSTSSYVLM